jgi:3-methyladenine DNA glycosylase/8-oxoguanine DNA glycosylase
MSEPLNISQSIDLIPTAPFNFDASLHKPDHFPSADNEWEPGIRWQTMIWQGRYLGLKFEDLGTLEQPRMALSIWSKEGLSRDFLDRLKIEISYRYSLGLDLSDFYSRFETDLHLGPVIDKWRGMRPLNYSSLYEYLIIAVMLQNATVRRSVQMTQALFENYGRQLFFDEKSLYAFWESQVIYAASEQELRDLKVGYRAKSLKRISEAFAKGEINELALRDKTREEQRQALLGLYGIGPASVGYILSDVFHHLDELEYISPWEQKIYSKLFFDRDPDEPVPASELLDYFRARFGEYRMLAVHYIWEDLFWRRKYEPVEWLEKLIRL